LIKHAVEKSKPVLVLNVGPTRADGLSGTEKLEISTGEVMHDVVHDVLYVPYPAYHHHHGVLTRTTAVPRPSTQLCRSYSAAARWCFLRWIPVMMALKPQASDVALVYVLSELGYLPLAGFLRWVFLRFGFASADPCLLHRAECRAWPKLALWRALDDARLPLRGWTPLYRVSTPTGESPCGAATCGEKGTIQTRLDRCFEAVGVATWTGRQYLSELPPLSTKRLSQALASIATSINLQLARAEVLTYKEIRIR
jgi:hypothetical protein